MPDTTHIIHNENGSVTISKELAAAVEEISNMVILMDFTKTLVTDGRDIYAAAATILGLAAVQCS